MKTPLESFIDYKADTSMQCGSYSVDLPELKDGLQYRFHFDATKCVSCRCCEVACNEQNNNPSEIKWRRVGETEAGEFPDTLLLFNSMSCNHCIEPACLIGCPTNSYIKFDNGIVYHDDEACIGCQYCTWNCPYGVPVFNQDRGIVTKCHMCHERLEENQTPACIQACPAGAIEIEVFDPKEWEEENIDKEGNFPNVIDARVTKSTTRYTLPKDMPKEFRDVDEHILKPFHPEFPLVFMTVLTQISLGGFFALMMGELFSLFGAKEPNWILALFVLIPAAIGLPLSALHLGRPIKAITAMKNLKTSYLSREALALGIFAGFMSINVILYFFEAPKIVKVVFEALTFLVGVYGIYAQSMIYRIEARPSWNRITTNLKFFTTSYVGFYLLAFVSFLNGYETTFIPLLATGTLLALAHGFFTYEDRRTLLKNNKYKASLEKTKRLYKEFFASHTRFRDITFITGSILLPQLAIVIWSIDNGFVLGFILGMVFVVSFISELVDRFLFYTTSVGLGIPGGFFVGNERV